MRWKAVVLAVAVSLAMAAPAFAEHPHSFQTPGNCVENIGRGQTAKAPGEPGYHQFHSHVHKGQPGMVAFGKGRAEREIFVGRTCPPQP